MGKVEIGNFYCLIEDNRILFLQNSLLNSPPLLKVTYMFMALTNSLVVLFIAVLLQIF